MTRARVARWLRGHDRALLLGLIAAGALLRVLLVVYSPTPFGYVWDFYHDGVRILYERGRLPIASDCWQCYHPPFFYVLGWPLYAFGRLIAPGPSDDTALRWLGALPLACGAVTVYYGYRLLRLFRCRGGSLVLGVALLLTFPCLFISSYAPEADVVVTAILSAFVFYLTRDAAAGLPPRLPDLIRLAVLVALAAATKYSGLVGLATLLVTLAWHGVRGPKWSASVGSAASQITIVLAVCALIAGWKYADNARWYGTPFNANSEAARGFTLSGHDQIPGHYEFTTLRLGDLVRTIEGRAPETELTQLPVYHSVFGTLHALAWSDLTFFSEPSRHGDPSRPYPRKRQRPALTLAVLFTAFGVDALGLAGLAMTIGRRRFLPMLFFCGISAAAYAWFFLAQTAWGLKTKYILFLLPPFVLYVTVACAWLWRRLPAVLALMLGAILAVFVALLHAYLFVFSVG